jgi:hypothetical protein
MQHIHSSMSETNLVSRLYNVAAMVKLQFMLRVMLFPMINFLCLYSSTFRNIQGDQKVSAHLMITVQKIRKNI